MAGEPSNDNSAVATRLEVIEQQALETRAESYSRLLEELSSALGSAAMPPSDD